MRVVAVGVLWFAAQASGATSGVGERQVSGLPVEVRQAHQALAQVVVGAKVSGKGLGTLEWKLFFQNAERFRLDIGPADAAERIVVVDGARVTAYERATNQYVVKRVSGRMFDGLTAILGSLDPLLEVYLDPASGLVSFLSGCGPLQFSRASGGSPVYRASPDEGYAVEIEVGDSDHLLRRLTLVSPEGEVAEWRVAVQTGDLQGPLGFEPPEGAQRVEMFGVVGDPPTFEGGALAVVQRSKEKYLKVPTLMYSSRTYQFTEGEQRTLKSNGWWERDGRFRFGVTLDSPARSFAVLYDEGLLLGWDRVARRVYRGAVLREEAFDRIRRTVTVMEGLMAALLSGADPWRALASSGATVSLRGESAILGGERHDVLDIEQADGWFAVVYVRGDGLISRVERSRRVEESTTFAETVLYDYFIVGEPIPSSAWDIGAPKDLTPVGWPPG
ncbi:MAG: hypothetical protein AB1725_06670 [Armatimonadota bacterium]